MARSAAGLVAYYLKQITDTRIGGHTVPDSVGAIGAGLATLVNLS
jgi:hypothetical protein